MDVFVQLILNGIMLGSMYAIIAVGLTLIFGIVRVVNFAHGEFLMIGMYAVYLLSKHFGLHPYVSAVPVIVLLFAVGALVQRFIIQKLLNADEHIQIFATVGLSTALINLALIMFGADLYSVESPAVRQSIAMGPFTVLVGHLVIFACAIALVAGLHTFMQTTPLGRAIRATAQNRDAAQLMGIRIGKVYAQVLAISGALAAISGIMISSLSGLLPNMGGDPMLKAFIICVVAGLGNVYGAAGVAIALGLLEAAIQYVFGVQYSFAILLLIVIAVLIWRPAGLFGKTQVVRL